MLMASRTCIGLRTIVLASLSLHVLSAFSCMNENNAVVDWWVALAVGGGSGAYYYLDSSSVASGFVKSSYDLSSTTGGAVMNTIRPIYTSAFTSNTAYMAYNDDTPPDADAATATYAHGKGVLLADKTRGFFLVHSKPNWPNMRATGIGAFPDVVYAQSLMCFTMSAAEIE